MEKYYLQIPEKVDGKDKFVLVLKTDMLRINEAATKTTMLRHR